MRKNSPFNLRLGASIITLLALAAIFGPFLLSTDPQAIALEKSFAAPSRINLFGCDNNGSDVLANIIYGARLSLQVGLATTIFSLGIALVLGSLAGFFGGKVDLVLMRLLEIVFAFPGIILAIAIASVMGPSKANIILALTATGWAGYTRLVRGEVRALKEKEYIQSARALGLSPARIIVFHIWPNLVSPLAVAATFGLAGAITAEASLSFLGVGVPPGTPSWGALLSAGKEFLFEAPHISAFPGIAIMVTILGFNFLGEGLRERLDPKG